MKKSKKNLKNSVKERRGLSPKQQQFVLEYLIDLNATQAAIRAKYSAKTAYSQGQRLLKNVEVAKAIEAAAVARAERIKVDADYVLNQAVKLHERCMQDIRPFTDKKGRQVTDEEGNLLFLFDSRGAAAGLKLVGEHVNVGAFAKRHVHSGPNNGPIPVMPITKDMDPKEAMQLYKQMLNAATVQLPKS